MKKVKMKKFKSLKIGDPIYSIQFGWNTCHVGKIINIITKYDSRVMFLVKNPLTNENYPEFINSDKLHLEYYMDRNIFITTNEELFMEYASSLTDIDLTETLDRIYALNE